MRRTADGRAPTATRSRETQRQHADRHEQSGQDVRARHVVEEDLFHRRHRVDRLVGLERRRGCTDRRRECDWIGRLGANRDRHRAIGPKRPRHVDVCHGPPEDVGTSKVGDDTDDEHGAVGLTGECQRRATPERVATRPELSGRILAHERDW
jgi:hypothetical protein